MNISRIKHFIYHPLNAVGIIRPYLKYRKQVNLLIDDFVYAKPVPNYNLKKVYTSLIDAYSEIMAYRRLDNKTIRTLKASGIKGSNLLHFARLSATDRSHYLASLEFYNPNMMADMAIIKNNAPRLMMATLEAPGIRYLTQKLGVKPEVLKHFILVGKAKNFDIDIIEYPFKFNPAETEAGIGLRLLKRIVQNEQSAYFNKGVQISECFDRKIIDKSFKLPSFIYPTECRRDAFCHKVCVLDRYRDAIDRDKIIPIIQAKINNTDIYLKGDK